MTHRCLANLVVALVVLAGSALSLAEENAAAPAEPAKAAPPEHCPVLSLDSLVHLSKEELEELYEHAAPGPIPQGYLRGKALRGAGTCLAGPRSKATGLIWHGKHFNSDCTLINQWCCGIQAIVARVHYGESWKDGKEAIVMDYAETSRVWADVRDEIRQITPGLYLGVMYLRKCPEPRFKMFFALEAACACE